MLIPCGRSVTTARRPNHHGSGRFVFPGFATGLDAAASQCGSSRGRRILGAGGRAHPWEDVGMDIKTLSVEAATAVADALAEAADDLEAIANSPAGAASEQAIIDAGQMRNDGRWLRKRAVAIRAELAGI